MGLLIAPDDRTCCRTATVSIRNAQAPLSLYRRSCGLFWNFGYGPGNDHVRAGIRISPGSLREGRKFDRTGRGRGFPPGTGVRTCKRILFRSRNRVPLQHARCHALFSQCPVRQGTHSAWFGGSYFVQGQMYSASRRPSVIRQQFRDAG